MHTLALAIGSFVLLAVLVTASWPVHWSRLGYALAGVAILAAYGLASWLIGAAGAGLYVVSDRLARSGVPPLLIIMAPALCAVALGWLARTRRSR